MKKIVCVMLFIILMLTSICFGEVPDLSGLSRDELLEVISLAEAQLEVLEGENAAGWLPRGRYFIGTDIRSGKYRFTSTNTIGFGPSVTIYKVAQDGFSMDETIWEAIVSKGETVVFTLPENTCLSVSNCEGVLEEYKSVFAP